MKWYNLKQKNVYSAGEGNKKKKTWLMFDVLSQLGYLQIDANKISLLMQHQSKLQPSKESHQIDRELDSQQCAVHCTLYSTVTLLVQRLLVIKYKAGVHSLGIHEQECTN